jgi:hypothetical protein
MSFTGQFNENFRRQSDLPSADLPSDTFEEVAEREAIAASEQAVVEVDSDE